MVSSVCMVVQSYCPDDPRVVRQAEALAARGARVDVICLRKEGETANEVVRGVRYSRLPIRRRRGGKLRYFFEYSAFFFLAFFVSSLLALRHRYDIFQAHNLPDPLIFCGALHRLRGAKLVLDLHDPMPELFTTKFHLGEGSLAVRFLEFQEKLSIGFSHLAIVPTLAFERTLVGRSRDESKLNVVMNSPDERLFPEPPGPPPRRDGSLRLLFNGVVAYRSGPDLAIRALAIVRKELPEARLDVFGHGDSHDDCVQLSRALGLEDVVTFRGQIPLEEMPRHLQDYDLGIVANRLNPFSALAFPTRIFEYLRMRKHAIVSRTPGVVDYFGEDGLLYFDPGDEEDLARAILDAHRDPGRAHEIMERALLVYDRYRWAKERERYLDLLDGLVELTSRRILSPRP
jgi:glycosyltransferase involved in cell wall biosynthesis